MEKHLQNSRLQGPVFSDVGIVNEVDPNIEELQVSSPTEYRTFSMRELVEIFPEAKSVVKRLVKEDEQALRITNDVRNKMRNWLYPRVNAHDLDLMTELMCIPMGLNFIEHKSKNKIFHEGEYRVQRLERNLKLLRLWDMPKEMTADFGAKIAKAKTYPIESLVKMNGMGFAKCPIHNEKTPSFKVDKKTNKWRCFGCNEHGDVIDLYQKIQGCDFKEAVNKLI